ncbi:hypothetical protein Pelo_4899 [Pelomyxa schiedti]|nr:hypothetical protein Pelo_4899 [Pelomyxa schiedti]
MSNMSELTGEAPFFIEHLRDPILPIDTNIEQIIPTTVEAGPYVQETLRSRAEIRDLVSGQQRKEKEKELRTMRKKTHQRPMEPKWSGPYRVLQVKSELIREINLDDSSGHRVVHVNRLKPFYGNEELVREARPPKHHRKHAQPTISAARRERIIEERTKDEMLHYRVNLQDRPKKDALHGAKR